MEEDGWSKDRDDQHSWSDEIISKTPMFQSEPLGKFKVFLFILISLLFYAFKVGGYFLDKYIGGGFDFFSIVIEALLSLCLIFFFLKKVHLFGNLLSKRETGKMIPLMAVCIIGEFFMYFRLFDKGVSVILLISTLLYAFASAFSVCLFFFEFSFLFFDADRTKPNGRLIAVIITCFTLFESVVGLVKNVGAYMQVYNYILIKIAMFYFVYTVRILTREEIFSTIYVGLTFLFARLFVRFGTRLFVGDGLDMAVNIVLMFVYFILGLVNLERRKIILNPMGLSEEEADEIRRQNHYIKN